MRILHTVEHYWPSRGGAQEVVRRISEALVRRGHDVTVATTRLPERTSEVINGVTIVQFQVAGNAAVGLSGETHTYQEFLCNGRFDVMMNYAAQQWATDLALPLLDKLPFATVLAPCGFSGLYWRDYHEYYQGIPGRLAAYDHLVFHSHRYRDIRLAREHGLDRLTVIPNGAAAAEFDEPAGGFRDRHGIPDGAPMLLTVGSHTGLKGHRLAVDSLLRIGTPNATLVIIGNSDGGPGCLPDCRRRARWARIRSLGRKRVLLLDLPREELIAAYRATDVFVLGSKVECSPIVLFEAVASGTPFVSSRCGNAEEIAEWFGSGMVVDGSLTPSGLTDTRAPAMAAAIDEVLGAADDWRRRAGKAREVWRRSFTWEQIAARYEETYRIALARRGRM